MFNVSLFLLFTLFLSTLFYFLEYVRILETQCTYCGLQILFDGGKREDRWLVICQCPGFVPWKGQ